MITCNAIYTYIDIIIWSMSFEHNPVHLSINVVGKVLVVVNVVRL